MNPIELHKPSGEPTGWTMCGECGQVASPGNLRVTEKCCTCFECGEPLPKEQRTRWAEGKGYALYHDTCQRRKRDEREAEALEKAELVDSYDGPVYFDGLRGSYGDGYFANVEELAETLEDREENERPEFAFCCEEIRPRPYDAGDFLEWITEEMDDDASERVNGVDQLDAAIREFYRVNGGWVSWGEDRKRKVKIPYRGQA